MRRIFLLLIAMLFVAGCPQAKDFNYGLSQLNSLNAKYSTTMETYPSDLKQIDAMHDELLTLKRLELSTGKEPFIYLVNYRILNLEAEEKFIESQKYGNAGTTAGGFGCKIRPLITESASLRNMSAIKGFEAVGLLREFVAKYPKEAGSANLSLKNALFLNATFYQISKSARSDSSVINNFCPKNVTLGIYQEEFKKNKDLSDEDIGKLTYEQAVVIWKKKKGII